MMDVTVFAVDSEFFSEKKSGIMYRICIYDDLSEGTDESSGLLSIGAFKNRSFVCFLSYRKNKTLK